MTYRPYFLNNNNIIDLLLDSKLYLATKLCRDYSKYSRYTLDCDVFIICIFHIFPLVILSILVGCGAFWRLFNDEKI